MTVLRNHKLLTLAGAAFAFRLLFVLIFPGPNYFEGISGSYIEVAQNILQGRGIVTYVDIAPLSTPEPAWTYETFIDRPLGYVFLILIPSLVTSSPIGVQILHALLAALSTVILFLIGKELVAERTAWRAALLYALWPLSARFEIALLPDAVMPFFLLTTLWLLLKGIKSEQGLKWYGTAGIVCGIGMTMRPDILILPLFLAAGLFFLNNAPNRIKGIVALLAGVLFVMGAHTARNYGATGGKILPLGLGNGISMWEGISQFGDTLGTVYGDERMARLEGYRSWAYPNGIERDRQRFREAVDIILAHPVWYAGMMVKRFPVLLTPDWIMTRKFAPSLKEFLDAPPGNTVGSYVAAYPGPTLIRVILVLLQYASLLLALYALWMNRRNRLLWLPALVIFYYIVIHLPTNTEARYFYPVIPLVLLLASLGWQSMKHQSAE
ncbi:MAG: glycosyltransferase family 39 protein [Ignavibacteriales bacterium]|nr:glycosyltransferase family 39 protein [Ignavibacteriales bacterium]